MAIKGSRRFDQLWPCSGIFGEMGCSGIFAKTYCDGIFVITSTPTIWTDVLFIGVDRVRELVAEEANAKRKASHAIDSLS